MILATLTPLWSIVILSAGHWLLCRRDGKPGRMIYRHGCRPPQHAWLLDRN